MALVEIEAGPHRITAAITRDAVEELGLAEGVAGDGDGEGDVGDDRKGRSMRRVALGGAAGGGGARRWPGAAATTERGGVGGGGASRS